LLSSKSLHIRRENASAPRRAATRVPARHSAHATSTALHPGRPTVRNTSQPQHVKNVPRPQHVCHRHKSRKATTRKRHLLSHRCHAANTAARCPHHPSPASIAVRSKCHNDLAANVMAATWQQMVANKIGGSQLGNQEQHKADVLPQDCCYQIATSALLHYQAPHISSKRQHYLKSLVPN